MKFYLKISLPDFWASLVAQTVKRLSTMWETRVRSLGWEDPLEKEMAIHSSTIAWKIPWTEEPGRLQSMGSQRVGHDWVTSRSWRKKWQPTPEFLPGKSHGQRNLVGYSPWDHKELDMTEQLHTWLLLLLTQYIFFSCLFALTEIKFQKRNVCLFCDCHIPIT